MTKGGRLLDMMSDYGKEAAEPAKYSKSEWQVLQQSREAILSSFERRLTESRVCGGILAYGSCFLPFSRKPMQPGLSLFGPTNSLQSMFFTKDPFSDMERLVRRRGRH